MVKVIGAAGFHCLRVGVRQFRLAHKNFAGDGAYRAEFAVGARGNLAGDLQPFADVAKLADSFPNLSGRAVHRDFQWDRYIGRVSYHRGVCRCTRLRRILGVTDPDATQNGERTPNDGRTSLSCS